MNELTLLEELSSDVAPASPEVRLRARRELLRAALEPQARRSGLRLRLTPAAPTRTRTRRRMPRAVLAGAAAALLAGGVLVVQAVESPQGASAQAAAVLLVAAESAAEQPFTAPRPDQFVYVRTEASWSSSEERGSYRAVQLYEAWLSVDGSQPGLMRRTYGEPEFFGTDTAASLTAAGITLPEAGDVETNVLPPLGNTVFPGTYAYLESLPTDPDELFDVIRAEAGDKGQSPEQEMLTVIADALRWSVAPPATRAALYEVASRVDGVEIVPGTRDFAGRAGTTVAVTTYGGRYELIFDPQTGDLLGTRWVVVTSQDGFEAGDVTSSDSTVVTVVDSVPPTE